MSTPETTTRTSANAPVPAEPPEPPRRPRRSRRRLGSRGIAIIASSAVLALLAGSITTALVVSHLERQSALALVQSALDASTRAAAELRTAQQTRADAETRLDELLVATDAVVAITGTGIARAATRELGEARAAAELPAFALEPPATVPAVPLETATTDELRAHAAALDAARERGDARTEAELARSELVTATADTLDAALADFSTAVAASGAKLAADRSDASATTRDALTASIAALTAAGAAALPDALIAYRAAAKAVVASSDKARAPVVGSGRTGTGIDDPTSLTVVVNKKRPLPAGYTPGDLRRPAGIGGALPLRAVAAAAAEKMAAAMAASGMTLRMSSGFRSFDRQKVIYSGFVAREGVAGADEHSARPGFSEHQTGLAADFDDGTGCNLNVCFKNAPGGKWLKANAWKYGFILRYGEGWQPIVGYRFEPWHYRYVGTSVAADMHAQGVNTLEEYFGLPAAPGY